MYGPFYLRRRRLDPRSFRTQIQPLWQEEVLMSPPQKETPDPFEQENRENGEWGFLSSYSDVYSLLRF